MSEETSTPPPRGPSFRNIKSFLRALYFELLLFVAFVSVFLAPSGGTACDPCAPGQYLLAVVRFAVGTLVLLTFYSCGLIIPLLAAPLIVGLARDYRRAARLDGGD